MLKKFISVKTDAERMVYLRADQIQGFGSEFIMDTKLGYKERTYVLIANQKIVLREDEDDLKDKIEKALETIDEDDKKRSKNMIVQAMHDKPKSKFDKWLETDFRFANDVLPNRILNALGRYGLKTWGDVDNLSISQIASIRNISLNGAKQVKKVISDKYDELNKKSDDEKTTD